MRNSRVMSSSAVVLSAACVAAMLTYPGFLLAPAFGADLSPGFRIPVPQTTTTITQSNIRFGTNRNFIGGPTIKDQFGDERGGPFYGKAEIFLSYERGSSVPASAQILTLRPFSERDFLDLSRHADRDRRARLFVHGYNYTFEQALVSGATLKAAVAPRAPMFVHAWPSENALLGYFRDVAEADYATPILRQTILGLARSSETEGLQIFGHSLGARPIIAALASIYQSNDRALLHKITDIVLAAPDVEQNVMDRDFLPVAEYARFQTIIYVSAADLAMWWSEKVNRHPRVGSPHKEMYIRKEAVTIDVSEVERSRWGHSLFNSPRVMADIFYALNRGISVNDRHGLRKVSSYRGNYWQMVP